MNAVTRCPACRARLGAAVQWCGQCHADLRPTPPSPTVPAPRPGVPDGVPGVPDGVAGVPDGVAGVPDGVEALAEAWARRLAESERGAGLPGLAGLTRDRAGRAGVALGAAVAVVLLVLGAMAVAGLLL